MRSSWRAGCPSSRRCYEKRGASWFAATWSDPGDAQHLLKALPCCVPCLRFLVLFVFSNRECQWWDSEPTLRDYINPARKILTLGSVLALQHTRCTCARSSWQLARGVSPASP